MEVVQKIPEIFNGKRVDAIAHTFFDGVSRSKIQKNAGFFLEKSEGFIEMSGKSKVHTDETWKIVYAEESEKYSHLDPWDLPLTILGESKDWVVIEKPEGISVHPSASEKTNKTIMNALLHQFGEKNLSKKETEIDGVLIQRPGLVHRLDKGTSGVLLVAKNDKTHAFLQDNWKKTRKIYYAVVTGVPSVKGKISSGIARDETNRQKMKASDKSTAKDAITYFERENVSQDKKYSLLKVEIPTGRTHQIRVHLASIGFPIVGDDKYGGIDAKRMFLHAQELQFPDVSGENIVIQSDIPKKFLGFFE